MRTELFNTLLPMEIQHRITSIAVDTLSSGNDELFWAASADGHFLAKSAYSLQNQEFQDPDEKLWKTIWRLPTPKRIRTFMWTILLGKIATNSLRFARKCASNPFCSRCQGTLETILHILRDCPPARYFWNRQIPGADQGRFFSLDQDAWLRENIGKEASTDMGPSWGTFFCTAVWLMWKNSCTTSFKGEQAALYPPSLAYSIMAKVKLWHEAWVAPSPMPGNRRQPADRVTANIGWKQPPEGWIALNIDGASCGNPGQAGAGGLLRDASGKWIAGFTASIGSATAALAELWAFYYGLDLAWKEGCRAVIVQSDSKLAIQLIEKRHDPVHPYSTLLLAIRRKLSLDWLVSISHTYREGNRAADWLSKHSPVYPYGRHELASPPSGLIPIPQDDARGVCFERQIVPGTLAPALPS
ncbi:unnamed protein product [Linum trigynum]|uniref:RNase H type-1 domain-containing protein n=1 Tax=Linum trigynum TaxID=586398 RepID=A0AAV2FN44_9ROSI